MQTECVTQKDHWLVRIHTPAKLNCDSLRKYLPTNVSREFMECAKIYKLLQLKLMNVYINAYKSFGSPIKRRITVAKWPQTCAYFHTDVTTLIFPSMCLAATCFRAIHGQPHIDINEMSIFIVQIGSGRNIETTQNKRTNQVSRTFNH